MKKLAISDTRQKILHFIREFTDDRGYSPTVRDILKGCFLSSTAVVQHHLKILEREGIIHRDPEVFRSIKLLDRSNIIQIPMLGTISAGEPIPVPETDSWNTDVFETIELADGFIADKDAYALRVKGLSMIDALIDDGDIVLMKPVKTANNGEMVAVWLKDKHEVTLKKFYNELDKVRLQPANIQMDPIYCKAEDIEIQGKVIGVLRKI